MKLKDFISSKFKCCMFVRNDMDYGTLECWASNSIGKQEHPCQFHVVRGGPPNPPKGCIIKNITYSGINHIFTSISKFLEPLQSVISNKQNTLQKLMIFTAF